jgi:hypothetical protein
MLRKRVETAKSERSYLMAVAGVCKYLPVPLQLGTPTWTAIERRWERMMASHKDASRLQRRQKFTRVSIHLASRRFVGQGKLVDDLIDGAGAITQSPDPGAGLVDRQCRAPGLRKQQNAVVRELMRFNVRVTNQEIHG